MMIQRNNNTILGTLDSSLFWIRMRLKKMIPIGNNHRLVISTWKGNQLKWVLVINLLFLTWSLWTLWLKCLICKWVKRNQEERPSNFTKPTRTILSRVMIKLTKNKSLDWEVDFAGSLKLSNYLSSSKISLNLKSLLNLYTMANQ